MQRIRDYISLDSVTVHRTRSELESPGVAFRVSDLSSLSREAINIILDLQPIIVVDHAKGYRCIAGLRTYQIASKRLPAGDLVPALVLRETTKSNIRKIAEADCLLTPLITNFKAPTDSIIECIKKISRNTRNFFLPNAVKNRNDIAKLLGVSPKTVYDKMSSEDLSND